MIRSNQRVRVCYVLLVLILIFIWGNSMLPGEISGAFSDWVKEILKMIFFKKEAPSTTGGGVLRKVAHFLEFASLGACLGWRFGMTALSPGYRFLCPLLSGVCVACVDEFIQSFVAGRNSSWMDVGIDSAGVLTGLSLLLLGHYMKTKILQRHKQQRQ